MGTDIHAIVEIKKEDNWKGLDTLPFELDTRNYSIFALIAGIDDYFNTQVFKIKGLPPDISGMHFRFKSKTQQAKARYENDGTKMCVLPDDSFINPSDEKLEKIITEEEYNKIRLALKQDEQAKTQYVNLMRRWRFDKQKYKYTVSDASIVGGAFKEVPYKKIYNTCQDFMDDLYKDEWNDEANDYGKYEVMFDSKDYHSFSYITLQEMVDADYSKYTLNKCKVPRFFYEAFKKSGGLLPDGFIEKETPIIDISSALSEIYDPNVMISWSMNDEEKKKLSFFEVIEELKEIARKEHIADFNNLRIVFAFDN